MRLHTRRERRADMETCMFCFLQKSPVCALVMVVHEDCPHGSYESPGQMQSQMQTTLQKTRKGVLEMMIRIWVHVSN